MEGDINSGEGLLGYEGITSHSHAYASLAASVSAAFSLPADEAERLRPSYEGSPACADSPFFSSR